MLIRTMSESATDQLLSAMRTLQIALDRHDAAISAAQNLARNDWRCLQFLTDAGPQSPRAIQRRLGLTSGTITALLDRLETRGFVERCAHPEDRRSLRIVPSAKAHALVSAAGDPLTRVTNKLAQRWGEGRSDATQQACLDLAKLVEWSAEKM